jgi:hypothetical protein
MRISKVAGTSLHGHPQVVSAIGRKEADVIEVVALAQGRDNCQADLERRGPEATELTIFI